MRKLNKDTIADMKTDLFRSLGRVRDRLDLTDPEMESAWAEVETFCALSLRIMAKTNLSKIKSELMTVEISARLAGHTVISPD